MRRRRRRPWRSSSSRVRGKRRRCELSPISLLFFVASSFLSLLLDQIGLMFFAHSFFPFFMLVKCSPFCLEIFLSFHLVLLVSAWLSFPKISFLFSSGRGFGFVSWRFRSSFFLVIFARILSFIFPCCISEGCRRLRFCLSSLKFLHFPFCILVSPFAKAMPLFFFLFLLFLLFFSDTVLVWFIAC